ncbi:hypothetical protein HAX39_25590, partial [Citrobacter freundii]|nr:hypothetical protein [Citrobacter freundii]
GKYVYDNQVVVPPQEENFNQAPGNAIWHMPFYLRGPKDSTEGANVYLCFSDGSKTASTLADQLMTIECSKWGLSSDNFHIRNIKDGIIFSLEYNPDNVPAINPADASKIYYLDKDWYQRSYLCPWVSQDDPNEAPLGCGSLYTSDSDRTYIFQGVFFIIACRYASSTVALIGSGNPVDWNVINRNNSRPNAGILYNYQSRYYFPVNYNEDGQDSTQLLRFYNFSKIDYDPNTVNGPLIMRQYKAYADYFNSVSGFYIGPVDVHPVITDKRDTLVRCGDSFGNLLEIKMRWSTGDDTYPSEQWSIQNVSIV